VHEFGEATPKMLAENLEVSEEDIAVATVLRQPTLSLTAPRRASDDDGRTLGDAIADKGVDVEGSVVHNNLMATVDREMKVFASTLDDEREAALWTERLIAEDPISLAALGERFGVSRERIRQIEARLKKRLKAYLTERLGESLELDFMTQE
jgi:RNA polymerase sigma-32 factor